MCLIRNKTCTQARFMWRFLLVTIVFALVNEIMCTILCGTLVVQVKKQVLPNWGWMNELSYTCEKLIVYCSWLAERLTVDKFFETHCRFQVCFYEYSVPQSSLTLTCKFIYGFFQLWPIFAHLINWRLFLFFLLFRYTVFISTHLM